MPVNNKTCPDLIGMPHIDSAEYVCRQCMEMGDTWVHLRICQECGDAHCCDSSKNKHATAHFHITGHPVVISAEQGEHWAWCYVHKLFAEF